MVKQGHGIIVNNSSIEGLRATNLINFGYHTSKFGVVGIADGYAKQIPGTQVKMFTLCPGYFESEMTAGLAVGTTKLMIASWHAINRWGTASEFCLALLFLFEECQLLPSGFALPVDGASVCANPPGPGSMRQMYREQIAKDRFFRLL